jgi:hypothetical protein
MIQRVFYRTREDGVVLWRTYSDEGYLIRQVDTGELYEEAIDVEFTTHTYEETNIAIEDYGNEEN